MPAPLEGGGTQSLSVYFCFNAELSSRETFPRHFNITLYDILYIIFAYFWVAPIYRCMTYMCTYTSVSLQYNQGWHDHIHSKIQKSNTKVLLWHKKREWDQVVRNQPACMSSFESTHVSRTRCHHHGPDVRTKGSNSYCSIPFASSLDSHIFPACSCEMSPKWEHNWSKLNSRPIWPHTSFHKWCWV